MNATHRDQKLKRGSPLAHCEPVTLVTSPDVEQSRASDTKPKLLGVTTAARPHLNTTEFQELQELVAEYPDIFARDSEDYRRTDKVYHGIDTGDARPIRQPPRRVPLAKQAEVIEMLDNMRRQGVIEREWPTPKDKHEARSFLGLCTYYRRFISGFAYIAKPLTRLTEEKQAFQWTTEVEAAFQTLKGALCAAPILAYPQPGEKFIVGTDGSNFGIGGVLSQIQDGQERVMARHSEDSGTFTQIPVPTTVPPAHGPLCAYLANEL
jgi:hypothetical protein